METNNNAHMSGSYPSPREALSQARRAEVVTRRPRLPSWFFVAMAALMALLMISQTLPAAQRTTGLFAVLIAAIAVNARAQKVAGISWAGQPIRGQLPFLAVMLVIIAGTAVAVAVTGHDWIWAVGAVPAAAAVLVTGVLYRRRVARS